MKLLDEELDGEHVEVEFDGGVLAPPHRSRVKRSSFPVDVDDEAL